VLNGNNAGPGSDSRRQTLLRAHRHHAGSTSASGPPRFSRLQGVTAETATTLLHLAISVLGVLHLEVRTPHIASMIGIFEPFSRPFAWDQSPLRYSPVPPSVQMQQCRVGPPRRVGLQGVAARSNARRFCALGDVMGSLRGRPAAAVGPPSPRGAAAAGSGAWRSRLSPPALADPVPAVWDLGRPSPPPAARVSGERPLGLGGERTCVLVGLGLALLGP
jgi:hypothetical protein